MEEQLQYKWKRRYKKVGFYGNITNTSKTTFSFDKVYSNRATMDGKSLSDGVFIGRYVLVEYDSNLDQSYYLNNNYLVGDTDGYYQIYNSVIFCDNKASRYYYTFAGPAGDPWNKAYIDNTKKVFCFKPHHRFKMKNNTEIFIKAYPEGEYDVISEEEFINKTGVQLPGTDDILTEEWIIEHNLYHAHIANGSAVFDDQNATFANDASFVYAIVLPGYEYDFNETTEFWIVDSNTTVVGEYYQTLRLLEQSDGNNYYLNYQIDINAYQASRGYDSTVWQKVLSNGLEKYVMIAELNTVIPTFGVTADPPTTVPISPHWGADSTNVYYDLHWQPAWGFRVKAASNNLQMTKINKNGTLNFRNQANIYTQDRNTKAREDGISYPSDVWMAWKHTFKDTSLAGGGQQKTFYYDLSRNMWGLDSSSKLPAAIYFNKDGFDSSKISYSSDLLDDTSKNYNSTIADSNWENNDDISVSATGKSGNCYNLHDGTSDLKPAEDTQELSIMLPSIGNIMAEVWDLVYGGRDTNVKIRTTGYRNKDIAWEDARGETARRGLRLTGHGGDEYNTAEVETIAGAINTTHDLLGMIISKNTANELSNPDNLDYNRIYYDTTNRTYKRKHKTYQFKALSDGAYTYNEDSENVNQEKIDQGLYYIEVNGEKVLATGEYDPNETYYLRNAKTQYEEIDKTIINFPYIDNGKVYKWHQDYLGEELPSLANTVEERTKLSDYLADDSYVEGKDYYTIEATPINLLSNYEPDMYWYLERDPVTSQISLLLDSSTEQTPQRDYYTFDDSNSELFRRFEGSYVYIPGKYAFKYTDPTTNKISYITDNSLDMSCNGWLNDRYKQGYISTDPQYNDRYFAMYYTINVVQTVGPGGKVTYYQRFEDYRQVYDAELSIYYVPNKYYIDTPNGKVLSTSETYDTSLYNYYAQEITYKEISNEDQVEIEVSPNPISSVLMTRYATQTFFQKMKDTMGRVYGYKELSKADFLSDENILQSLEIYVFGDTYIYQKPYKTITEVIEDIYDPTIIKQDAFYSPGLYHYKTANDSYLLDTNPQKTHNAYYTIEPTKLTLPDNYIYYQPGKYYEESNNEDEYTLVNKNSYNNETLFKEKELYVISDSRGILPEGTLWNENALNIPGQIVLGTRDEKTELIPFKGYSIDTGTINGTLLELAHLIEPNDKLTRDQNTVSGAINTLKDKIAYFGNLKSREFMLVDDYGRIRSTKISTTQTFGTGQNQYDKRWLDIKINGDPVDPLVTINHIYNPQPNEDTVSHDFNLLSNNDKDQITINWPVFDEMGHKVAEAPITYTLPFGYKTVAVNDTNIEALETQDLFTITNNEYDQVTVNSQEEFNSGEYYIKNGDKYQRATSYSNQATYYVAKNWIVLEPDVNSQSFNIKHNTFNIDTSDSSSTDINDLINNNINDVINIPDWTYDSRGHITAKNNHLYTLPFGFKNISLVDKPISGDKPIGKRDLVADNTQDTLEIRNETQEKIVSKNVDVNNFGDKPRFILNNGMYEAATNYLEGTTYFEDSEDDWITLRTDDENDLLLIGHKTSVIDETDAAEVDLNNGNIVNIINIPEWTYDTRGHILSKKNKQYTLPYSFKTFVIEDTSLIPGNVRDTFTIKNSYSSVGQISSDQYGSGVNSKYYVLDNEQFVLADTYNQNTNYYIKNEWVVLDPNASTNTLQISHKTVNVDTTEDRDNDNEIVSAISGGKFSIPDIKYDEAGHFTALKPHKYQLSNSFGNIKINNDSPINPTSYDDTIIINGDSNWIEINNNNKIITINHKAAYEDVNDNFVTALSDKNLTFGDTFKLLNITYDSKGHIVDTDETTTITLPTPSLTVAQIGNVNKEGNVIIGLSLDTSSGTLTYTPEYLGNLKLQSNSVRTLEGEIKYLQDQFLFSSLTQIRGYEYSDVGTLTETQFNEGTYYIYNNGEYQKAEIYDSSQQHYYTRVIDNDKRLTTLSDLISLENNLITLINTDTSYDYLTTVRGFRYEELEDNSIVTNENYSNYYILSNGEYIQAPDANQVTYYQQVSKRLLTSDDSKIINNKFNNYLLSSAFNYDGVKSLTKVDEQDSNITYHILTTEDDYVKSNEIADFITENDLPDVSGMVKTDTTFIYEPEVIESWPVCNPYPTQEEFEANPENYWISNGNGGYTQCSNQDIYAAQVDNESYYYTHIEHKNAVTVTIDQLIAKVKQLEALIN